MRCSLLTLSSYVDNELDTTRTGELEAHLIGCGRCSTALTYLREETDRIATLAHVHVPQESAHEMFALVGLAEREDDDPGFGHHDDGGPGTNGATYHHTQPEPHALNGNGYVAAAVPRSLLPPPVAYAPPHEEHVSSEPHEPVEPLLFEPPEPPAVEPAALNGVGQRAWENHAAPAPLEAAEPERETVRVQTPQAVDRDDLDDWDPRLAPFAFEPEPVDRPQAELVPPALAYEYERGMTAPDEPTPPEHAVQDDELLIAGVRAQPPEFPIGPPPSRVPTSGVSGLMHRMRDSLSVRLALMRGPRDTGERDGIEIISGTGAPRYEGRPAHHAFQRRIDREQGVGMAQQQPSAVIAAQPDVVPPATHGDVVVEEEREATGYAMPVAPVDHPFEAQPHPDTPAPAHVDEPIASAHVEAPAAPPLAEVHESARNDVPEANASAQTGAPGRHMRSLARSTGGAASSFAGLGQFTAAVARRTGAQRRHVAALEHVDRRLWIFGAAVVVLMLLGLVLGKSVTPFAPVVTSPTTAHPSAAPSVVPSLAPSAAATPAPTAVPTPTPAAGPALVSPTTVGSGGTGYNVDGLRFGVHGSVYRLVFDLSGGSGEPTVLVGYDGSATQLYVEFSGGTTAGTPNEPSGRNLLASVQLLPPNTVPGKTVYQLTLKRHATYSASYVSGPRLVIDLS